MRRAQRLEAIQRIGRALSVRSWADIDLLLRTFDFPTADDGNWNGEYQYVLEMLGGNDKDIPLAELDEYLQADSVAAPTEADEDQVWRPGSFRVFISHTNGHKKRAALLARIFDRLGVHGFVAHDTIEPTRQWQDVIETALRTCDAMCAMVTTDFVESRWCDQEVGFVVGQRKLVMPLKMGADPYGFIGKYQAITSSYQGTSTRANRDASFDDIEAMLLAMVRHPSTSARAAPVAVRRYTRTASLDSARTAFTLLQAIPAADWSPAMIEDVDRANADNASLRDATLGGTDQTIPEGVNELLKDLRPPAPPAPAADDDIPF